MDERERVNDVEFQRRLLVSIETLHKRIAEGVTCSDRWCSFLELALQLTSSAKGLVALRSHLAPPHTGA